MTAWSSTKVLFTVSIDPHVMASISCRIRFQIPRAKPGCLSVFWQDQAGDPDISSSRCGVPFASR